MVAGGGSPNSKTDGGYRPVCRPRAAATIATRFELGRFAFTSSKPKTGSIEASAVYRCVLTRRRGAPVDRSGDHALRERCCMLRQENSKVRKSLAIVALAAVLGLSWYSDAFAANKK